MIFISDAYAQAANTTASGEPSFLMSMLPLALIMIVFYFLLIRPQTKRFKEHQSMLANLRRGDKVVTSGGIIGAVVKLESDTVVVVEIAPDVKVRVSKPSITSVVTKNTLDNEPEEKEEKPAVASKSAAKKPTARKTTVKK